MNDTRSKSVGDMLQSWTPSDGKPNPKPKKGSTTIDRRKKSAKVKARVDRATKPKATRRVPIGARLRSMVFERDGHRCVLCGRAAADGAVLHAGHILAVARGGTNCESNLRTECAECSIGGGARTRIPPRPTPASLEANDRLVEKLQVIVGKKRKPKESHAH